MKKNRTIKKSERQVLLKRHLLQVRIAGIYYKKLYRERLQAFNDVRKACKGMNANDIADYIPLYYKEDTEPILKNLYKVEATTLGSEFFIQKSEPLWWADIEKWIETYTGEKVGIISGTARDTLIGLIQKILKEDVTEHGGIEMTTTEVFDKCRSYWEDVQKWQVRRIILTEAMEAGAVGSISAVNSLDIEYEKTWACSMRNSREDHVAMDGITIGQDENFTLPNGDIMKYPHDPTLGAGPENLVNCSCDCLYYPV